MRRFERGLKSLASPRPILVDPHGIIYETDRNLREAKLLEVLATVFEGPDG